MARLAPALALYRADDGTGLNPGPIRAFAGSAPPGVSRLSLGWAGAVLALPVSPGWLGICRRFSGRFSASPNDACKARVCI